MIDRDARRQAAVALRRLDWLRQEGFEDLDGASARLGEQWFAACKVVMKARMVPRLKLVEQ